MNQSEEAQKRRIALVAEVTAYLILVCVGIVVVGAFLLMFQAAGALAA